jgi:hypothetical protein
MFIKYNPKNPHVKTIPVVFKSGGGKAIPIANNYIILRPGTIELTEQEWEAIQPHIQDEIKQKIIVPFTVPVKKAGGIAKAKTLKDVPVSVARKIIESCQNAADLKKWVRQELPDEIMLLVLKRLRKLKIDPDEFSDDLSGEDTLDEDITPEENGEDDKEPIDNDGSKKGGKTGGRNPRPETPEPKGEGASETQEGDDTGEDDPEDEIPDFDGSGGGGGA